LTGMAYSLSVGTTTYRRGPERAWQRRLGTSYG
jgi:hypothetical protein